MQKIRARNQKKDNSSPDSLWLCGKHPVFLALQKKRRKILQILATPNAASELEVFLKQNSLTNFRPLIKIADRDKIDGIVGKNQVHQGIALNCSKLPTLNQHDLLQELYDLQNANSESGKSLPTLLLLDQVSDPHNIGAIIRSAASFGAKKIIFSEHNSPKENATIVKSSAGTIEFVDLVVVTNFNNLIEKLKKIGYWCIGLDGYGTASIAEARSYKNIALIVGSEGNGMRDLVKKNCDLLVKIDISPEVESLNASVATAIALYEIAKK